MKITILVIGIISLFISSSFFVLAEDVSVESVDEKTVEIRVAIYTDEEIGEDFLIRYSGSIPFIRALNNFKWKVNNTQYCIKASLLKDEELLDGELTNENYDVLIYTAYMADSCFWVTGFHRLPKNERRVKIITDFVENGGGYFGQCGGAAIACTPKEKIKMIPRNSVDSSLEKWFFQFFGRQFRTSCMSISCVEFAGSEYWFKSSGIYFWYAGWKNFEWDLAYAPDNTYFDVGGVCLDFPVDTDHPIFDDIIGNTRRMRWDSSADFKIPDNPDRDFKVLMTYPEEISDNPSYQIHKWKYTGGILGLIKSAKLADRNIIQWVKNFYSAPYDLLAHATDWEKTNEIVKMNLSDQPFMTAEVYPNPKQARMVLCVGHPEKSVWWDGHFEDAEDTDENNLYDGLYRLVDFTPFNETIEDELNYNHCIIQRSISWASKKVPDTALPPIYGASQVTDILPYQQPTEFTIEGNAESSNGIMSLDLFYRYSPDNSSCSWTDWIYHSTDNDCSDGWSWEFDSPNEAGYYEFYSIRKNGHGYAIESEIAPPGPDAIAHVVE